MSQYGVTQAEIIDSLISDLSFVAVSFQSSSRQGNAKMYIYKYITSQLDLKPGDHVVVERRSTGDGGFGGIEDIADAYMQIMADPMYFNDSDEPQAAPRQASRSTPRKAAQIPLPPSGAEIDVSPRSRINRNLAVVVRVVDAVEYPPTAETFATHIGWVVSKIDTAQHDANLSAEKDLWDAVKRRVVESRREQIIRAMLGDIALDSPLIKPKALT